MLILEPDGRVTSYPLPQPSFAAALRARLVRVVRRYRSLARPTAIAQWLFM